MHQETRPTKNHTYWKQRIWTSKSFKYLGSSVNTDNTIEEEIKERIALGNKAFFTNKKMFQSKLISKMAKLKLYCSVMRPVVTYACETWIIKETITNRLIVFERKVLRKIFGPTNENQVKSAKLEDPCPG